jgi:hypothetical protein
MFLPNASLPISSEISHVVLFGMLKLSKITLSGLNKSVRNLKREKRDDEFNKNKEKVTQRT